MVVPPASVTFPRQRSFAPSVTSVSYLKLRKTSGRIPSMKAVRPVINSNGVPSFQMKSIGSSSTLGREEEGKNGEKQSCVRLFQDKTATTRNKSKDALIEVKGLHCVIQNLNEERH